jgi:type II secretory pathway predicted ATPase ExeA
MYEAHFGLKSSPFGSKAEGAGVFVGPQQTKIMKSLHKGLSAKDAVVTISGPVGVGKTTIVSRALETISPGRMVAWVGRMPLSAHEVVDLLLAGFGIRKQSKGTIQRFAAFRRLLAERAATGVPVAIVVEDAHRIGSDALGEIEALTAADTGDSTGANIILMGQPGLNDLLSTPDLARLKQRTRLRQSIEALSLAEVSGYLKHCIREAGGDYDTIFEPGVADIVFDCSEGIPRVINTICATALTTAAEENVSRVSAAMMHKVASDAFGYDGPIPDTPEAPAAHLVAENAAVLKPAETAPAMKVTPEPRKEPEIDWEKPAAVEDMAEEDLPMSARNVVVESGCYPETAASVPNVAAEPVVAETAQDIDDIPELINDTQPELSALKISDEAIEPKPIADLETEETADKKSGDTAILESLPETAALKTGGPSEGTSDDSEVFDLDAALSIETDATNVMEGITPNLDKLASEAKEADKAASRTEAAIAENAAADKAAAEKAAAEKAEAEKAAAEKAAAEKAEAEKAAAEKAAAEKAAAEKAEAEKAEAEKAEAEKAAAEKAAAEKAEAEKAAAEKAEANKAAAEENELPSLDDLPTLSDSMRVDVNKEVERAKQVDDAPALAEDAIAKSKQAPPQNISELTARISAINPDKRSDDVDALEAALEAAKKSDDLVSMLPACSTPTAASVDVDEVPTEIPEITLDKELPGRSLDDQDLLKAAEEIGSANSLEDISDDMAETLFGSQAFDKIAEEVVANPPKDHEIADAPPDGPSPVKIDEPIALHAANDAIEPALELETAVEAAAEQPSIELEIAVEPETQTGSTEIGPGEAALNESVAMRIDMLNAMKSKVGDSPAEVVELGEDAPTNTRPKARGPQPEPIENQINTSITQTLKALNVNKIADKIAADESKKKQKKSGGLFSRFRKSS